MINFELIRVLMLGELPAWPGDAILAVKSTQVHCGDCLVGGITDGVLVGVVSAACMIAILVCVTQVNHRPMRTWITAAPRFRWRLFFVDIATFLFCAFFAWKSWLLLEEAIVEGYRSSSTWQPPLWIPYSLMAAGMTLLSIQVLFQVIAQWRRRSSAV